MMTDVEQKAIDKLTSSIKSAIGVLALGRGVGSQAAILNDLITARNNIEAMTKPAKAPVAPRRPAPAKKAAVAKKRSSI
jgi:hypothetical protein